MNGYNLRSSNLDKVQKGISTFQITTSEQKFIIPFPVTFRDIPVVSITIQTSINRKYAPSIRITDITTSQMEIIYGNINDDQGEIKVHWIAFGK